MKITDKVLLGAMAGLGGHMLKMMVQKGAKEYVFLETGSVDVPPGSFIPAHKLREPLGSAACHAADSALAALFGIGTVCILACTGRDKAVLKGALAGQTMWSLYGSLTDMTTAKAKPASLKAVLFSQFNHMLFGAATATIASLMGQTGMFAGDSPTPRTAKNTAILQNAPGELHEEAKKGADQAYKH